MKKTLVHPTYFGSIAQFVALSQAEKVCFEVNDNYQKQTYRSRQYIYGANGRLLLNIPVKHNKSNAGKQKYKDIKIEDSFKWQLNHWRSLETAYRTSPFFEYYEDEFIYLYEKPFDFLLDFNFECLKALSECLQLDLDFSQQTTSYQLPEKIDHTKILDVRTLVNAKKEPKFNFSTYEQVFNDKYGFLSNLSALDLLFNEGPNALTYLESQLLELS